MSEEQLTEQVDEKQALPKRSNGAAIAKIVVFLALAAAIVILLSPLLTPLWNTTHTRATVREIYDLPNDSIEVAFFGTSTTLTGMSPMQLYSDYGISAFNCATSTQPTLVAYHLLKDLLEKQGGSLKTVVIDPISIVDPTANMSKAAHAERVSVNMDWSLNKLEMLHSMVDEYSTLRLEEQVVPVLRYHSRWNELTSEDYSSPLGETDYYTLGQYIRFSSNAEEPQTASRKSTVYKDITDTLDFPEKEIRDSWDKDNKAYLDQIAQICGERGIDLVFINIPRTNWGDRNHDSLVLLGKEYGCPVVDFAQPNVWDECGLEYATDYSDAKHPNIKGAQKLSRYLGDWLKKSYSYSDARVEGNGIDYARYSQLYEEALNDYELQWVDNLGEYLDRVSNERYTTFIITQGNVGSSLSDATRHKLHDIGITGLSTLRDGQSYAGVVDANKPLAEKKNDSSLSEIHGDYRDGKLQLYSPGRDSEMIPYAKVHVIGTNTILRDEAEIDVGTGESSSESGRGLSFVVCNRETKEILDTSCFDTFNGGKRTSDLLAKDK